MNHEAIHAVLPTEKDNKIKFKNYNNIFKHPVSCYLDFESTLTPVDETDLEQKTQKYQKHECNSVGIKYNCIHDEYSTPITTFASSNSEEVLKYTIETLEEKAIYSYKITKQNERNYIISKEQSKLHYSCKTCTDPNCKTKEFTASNKKVIHHDHITGQYISTICNNCNLNYKVKKFLPIYIHNLKGYDSHFLVPALNKYGYKNNDLELISAIPSNEEKYISFSKKIKVDEFKVKDKLTGEYKIVNVMYEIRFIDTLGFMASSLCSLVENLKSGHHDIINLRKAFKNTSERFTNDSDFFLMIQKGIYPYDYISSFDKLHETQLPSIYDFYSRLSNESCKKEDYERAQIVWKHFNCKTILDYHTLYLESDVLLLADVFETFKSTCYKIYGLDPTYYYTSPGLSWDAFLKHSNEQSLIHHNKEFEIELLTDMDMYLFVENSIRGGLSQISKRYAKANNKYMSNYDDTKSEEYILYLDANNLYGYAMCEFLPKGQFKWNNDEWTTEKIMSLDDEGHTGYLFDVNLEYPTKLHDLHNGYALGCQNSKIKADMLNKWQQDGYSESNIEKLITTLDNKKNYGINYRLLKLFLSLGLILTAVNRVLQYHQDNYMKSYIMKNTNERTKATNDFEKDFYKLMNNSVYGKTMENVRNRINFRLISSEASALAIRNTRIRYTIFDESLVGVHLCKQEVQLNKPIFIGQNVLDQSKYLMYDFHYNTMLKNIKRENIDLLFTDTDSLCYHIKNQDPYNLIREQGDLFDLSNYPKDHELYNKTNAKVIGKFKNESVKQISEFVGLRSKLYAYKVDQEYDHKKCKGVKQSVVKKDIQFENYYNTLLTKQSMTIKQNTFRSYKHVIYTETITKVALSANDDKCYIQDNNIDTYTIGHYKTK